LDERRGIDILGNMMEASMVRFLCKNFWWSCLW
jgi:hypothetical protein